jgi:manganese efflux pump family protein
MAKLLFLAFALSLDTFIVSIALGTMGLGRAAKRNLVLLFAFCDGAASLAGRLLAAGWLKDVGVLFARVEASVLCLYAILIVALGWYARAAAKPPRDANWLYALPFVLCLDNFMSGLSFNATSVPLLVLAAIVGVTSALMSLVGLQIGSMVGTHLPIRVLTCAGAGLLCLVAAMALR